MALELLICELLRLPVGELLDDCDAVIVTLGLVDCDLLSVAVRDCDGEIVVLGLDD